MNQNTFQSWQSIRGKLHDERSRLTLDDGRAQQLGNQQRHRPGEQGDAEHDLCFVLAEEGCNQEQENGKLGTAWHKGSGDQGSQLLFWTAQRPGCHNARYGAAAHNAAGNDEGHGRAAMQAEDAQGAVKHVGDTGHVTGVFKKRDHQEHDGD